MSNILASKPFLGLSDTRYFRNLITIMALVVIAGFSTHLFFKRSSFDAPLYVHLHAVVFMGWVGLIVTQAWLAAAGNKKFHLILGIIAAFWAVAVLVAGNWVNLQSIRDLRTPFFFYPQYHLIVAPLSLIGFFVLTVGAIILRKNQDWHTRLHIGGFVMLMGAGVGRLIPMPLLIPYSYEIAALLPLVFVLFSMIREVFVYRKIHVAWFLVIGLLFLTLSSRHIAFTPFGDELYRIATKGSLAEGTNGRLLPPPPPMPPVAP